MAPHEHDLASLNIIVAGDFQERIGNDDRVYARGQIAFCPAGVTHSQKFGRTGARQIIFRPQDAWLAYLADCNINLADAPYTGSPAFRHLGDRLLDELARKRRFLRLRLRRHSSGNHCGAGPERRNAKYACNPAVMVARSARLPP